jgi:hypothetical protein
MDGEAPLPTSRATNYGKAVQSFASGTDIFSTWKAAT